MARRTFFSFHYQADVFRAQVVRNSWVTKADREDAGFFDASVFEAKKRESPESLRRFLREALDGSSVACALTGTETASRRWVRYEMLQALKQGRGLMEISIHSVTCPQTRTAAAPGPSTLASLGLVAEPTTVRFCELKNGEWHYSEDVPSMPRSDLKVPLPAGAGSGVVTLNRLFDRYDWNLGRGYENLGSWVETAARRVGR